MSQLLTPQNGGFVPEVQTTTAQSRLNVLSPQYIEANNLQSRPTEWNPAGRPIYRRLPAVSETYQIDFFNLVTESNLTGNTSVRKGITKVGYVYVPWGASINGPVSVEVVKGEGDQTLLIKAGVLVWEYGKTEVLPTIINTRILDVGSGKYDIAYQLIYDDAPFAQLYSVTDFALAGQPMDIVSSTDSVIGWRYPAENAFLNSDTRRWSNEDSFFPAAAQPATAFLQWASEYTSAYSSITLRCPSGTAYDGTATLYYVNESALEEASTVPVSVDTTGQYFQFDIAEPTFSAGWRVEFSSPKVSIQSTVVSGTLTLLEPVSAPSPRAVLVMYPAGTLPKTVENSQGEVIPATYVTLAEVDFGNNYNILDINDTRTIIHRDYVPVADWLTVPFDSDLIDLYEQVSEYSKLWMSPPLCMKQEYENLKTDQITVEA
jgi:hypothetical protein